MSIQDGTRSFDFYEGPVMTFDAAEGTFTVTEDGRIVNTDQTVNTGVYTSELSVGDFVIATADYTVGAASAGTQNLLGVVHTRPTTGPTRSEPNDESGNPYTLSTSRTVAIELFGLGIKQLPLSDAGTAVAIAESVKPDADEANKWDGEGALNNDTYAITAGTPGTETTVDVVVGYWGAF